MTKRQEAKLNMYNAVINFCDDNTAIVTSLAAFPSVLEDFKDKVHAIESTGSLEVQVIKGIRINKTDLKKTLCDVATSIAAATFAFASSTNDLVLKERARFANSDLFKEKDKDLPMIVKNIHDDANANIASLAGYGITSATLTSFQANIDNYNNYVPAPRNAVSMRSSYRSHINTMFTEADAMLKEQMDKLALQLKPTHIEFYAAYRSNRVIVDAATSSTQLTGTVVNGTTPLNAVVVEVVDTAYITNTAANGQYTLKIPVPGTYSIQFSHTGFPNNTIHNIKITLGQSTTLNANLAPL